MSSDTESNDGGLEGMDRRSLLKRSALLGGALVWTTPIVQTIAQPAFAMGSEAGGGGQLLCPKDLLYRFKHLTGTLSLVNNMTPAGGCGLTSAGTQAMDSALVQVTYDRAPANPPQYGATGLLSRATITLAPGYRMTQLTWQSNTQDAAGTTTDGRCPGVLLNPQSSSGSCTTGRTYVVISTAIRYDLAQPTLRNLRYVMGEFVCEPCPPA